MGEGRGERQRQPVTSPLSLEGHHREGFAQLPGQRNSEVGHTDGIDSTMPILTFSATSVD